MKEERKRSTAIFDQVLPEKSGIHFSNDIRENLNSWENLFDFDYFYNGAGVGIADLNNDGLEDLFFTGNQVNNRLYLNKGNLRFKNITRSAGINHGKHWANGVTFADVNGDGWLDIYISQGGALNPSQRENLLFINQQNLTFKEQAKDYGLADDGLSTQSVFFDYDGDGDLDCLVMNETPLYGHDPIRFYRMLNRFPDFVKKSSNRLYRNDGNLFTDVTDEAGLLNPSFGLGLVVSDVNKDGQPDIYIANDYYIPDALYINQGDGRFRDEIKERTGQISYAGMGVDIADLNNDGQQEIFVLDMAPIGHYRNQTLMQAMNFSTFNLLVERFHFVPQYRYNSLQLNLGKGYFSNYAHAFGLAKSNWSWAGLMADFDNNGKKEIFVTNGYRRYATNLDTRERIRKARGKYGKNIPLRVKKDLYYSMPSEKVPNMLFKNYGELQFVNKAGEWGLGQPTYSNGAAVGDLDNDGDLDLVVNNINDKALLYENRSVGNSQNNYLRVRPVGTKSEAFAKVTIWYQGRMQFQETKRVRGYYSAVEPVAHFGLGNISRVDSLWLEWPSGKIERRYDINANQEVIVEEDEPASRVAAKISNTKIDKLFNRISAESIGIDYVHRENEFNDFGKQPLIPYWQSRSGPPLATGDVDGDGQTDLFIGGASGQAGTLWLQRGTHFKKVNIPDFIADRESEDVDAAFLDFDSDGDQDLFVVSGGNEHPPYSNSYSDRLYRNEGKGRFVKVRMTVFKKHSYSGGSVAVIDYDKDQDPDLVVGNKAVPHNYPRVAPSHIYENNNGNFRVVTQERMPALQKFGIINKVLASDFNNDGWNDLVVAGEWTGIGFFQNKEGKFENISPNITQSKLNGWWFTVVETDINGDGWKDYLLGNLGTNSRYKASVDHPLYLYSGDFNNDGRWEPILARRTEEGSVPIRKRNALSRSITQIRKKGMSHEEFAQATIKELMGNTHTNMVKDSINELRSLILINRGGNRFQKQYLPTVIQGFPILSALTPDVDGDGNRDLIVGGNIYHTDVTAPRLDASSIWLLYSDGTGKLRVAGMAESGLYNRGNIKSLAATEQEGKGLQYLMASQNDTSLALYSIDDEK